MKANHATQYELTQICIDQPFFDKKTGSLALIGVMAVHGMVAVGLATMAMPDIKPSKVTPTKATLPLEIHFIAPPPVAVKPDASKIQPTPKSIETKPIEKPIEPKIAPVVPPKSEPKVKPTPEKTIEPKLEPKPVQPLSKPIKPISETLKAPEKPVVKQPEPDQNIIKAQQLAETNERTEREREQQQEQQQEQQRQQEFERQQALANEQALAKQQALEKQQAIEQQKALAEQQERDRKQAEADAQKKQVEAENARQKALADAKAKQDAEESVKAEKIKQAQAKKDKEVEQAKQAQSNSPVTFSAGQASWRRQPNFSCSSDDTAGGVLTANIRYVVDKQGNPSNVTLSKSTGNAKVDRQLTMQARSGKFNPFTKDGIPVVGIVNLPIRCQ